MKLDDATLLDLSADRLLLDEYAPSGFLVNSENRVVKFRGQVGPYLAPRAGDPELDILKLVHQDIALVLRSALDEANSSDSTVRRDRIQVRREGDFREISLIVRPLSDGTMERHFLVLFEEALRPPQSRRGPERERAAGSDPGSEYQNLVLELSSTRTYMQRLVEELRSANEEAQSSNEELQSTNEELQTAKEELQSSNEELTTTNEEMRGRNSELNQVNNDLLNLLSSLQIPIVMLDRKLRIRRYTPIAEQVLNLIPSDVGRPISDLKPRINVTDLEGLLAKVVESVQPMECEVQDQEDRWYSLRVQPYRTGDNTADGVVLQLVSINELKLFIEEVNRARDYAEAIIRTVREPLVVLDHELRVQTANRAFFDTFRTSSTETLNRKFFELDGGRWNSPMILRLIEELQDSHIQEAKEVEIELDSRRLGRRAFRISGRRFERGQQNGLLLLALEDVTERKRVAEAKYRRLFEAAKDGIVMIDADSWEIIDVNPFMLELSGLARTDFIGQKFFDVKALSDLPDRDSVRERLQKEEIVRFPEMSIEIEPGRHVEVEVVANMYKDGERRVVQFNLRDITERKRLNQKMQQTARLEGLGILAGGIAHDFNNLLAGILGNAGLALSDAPPGSPYHSALKDVVRASQRAADLTRQMLAYSGRGRFVVRPLNLSELVVEVSNLVRSTVPTSVELEFDLAKPLPSIHADSGQIQQIIMNLIINGAEAIGEGQRGTVRVSTRAERLDATHLRRNYPAETLSPGLYVVLEVSDTGSGMDENTQARIFDPFFTTKFTGRGLGLASVHGIIHGHEGAIRVQSAIGRGSTFTIVFPATETPVVESEPLPTPEDLSGTGTILVVDDEEIALSTMRAILERNGYRVHTAANGEIAVNVVRERKAELSLVIMDVAMPVMGGIEAFFQISAIAPDLPVLLTSGYDESEGAGRLGEKTPAGFIQKPASVTDLLEKVKSVLSK